MAFLFGKKKKVEETPPPVPVVKEDPKKQLDITRQNMAKILDALNSVDVARIRKSVPDEVMSDAELSQFDRDLRMVKAVISKQTSSQLVLAESESIDQELLFFAEHIQNEMCDGHFSVSETYMKAIKFGISKGHEAIKESDIENKDAILNQRLEIIKHYKHIATLHESIAKYQDNMVQLQRKLEDLQANYQESLSIAQEQQVLHKEKYDKILRMSPSQMAVADSDLRNFAAIFDVVNELSSQIDSVKTNISGIDDNIHKLKRAIGDTENALLSINSVTTEKEREEMERINRQYIENLKNIQDQSFAFDDLFKDLDASIKAINSDPRIIRKMVETVTKYEDNRRKEENRRQEEARGMERLEEMRRKQMEELDDDIKGMEEDLSNTGIENEQEKHKILL